MNKPLCTRQSSYQAYQDSTFAWISQELNITLLKVEKGNKEGSFGWLFARSAVLPPLSVSTSSAIWLCTSSPWESISYFLNLEGPCNLLRTIKYYRDDSVPVLSLSFKRLCLHQLTVLYTARLPYEQDGVSLLEVEGPCGSESSHTICPIQGLRCVRAKPRSVKLVHSWPELTTNS